MAEMNNDVIPVSDEWVKFLVRDLNPGVIASYQLQAYDRQTSVAEVMRQTLCAHFDLDCVPSRGSARPDSNSTTRLLRLQPELFERIKLRSRTEGVSMQQVVRAALGA